MLPENYYSQPTHHSADESAENMYIKSKCAHLAEGDFYVGALVTFTAYKYKKWLKCKLTVNSNT